jgi:class 3 adenylate cyclase/tetratricopeptide (TPR) repeat protein
MESQSEIANLMQAMSALENQRAALGDAVVEAALAPLRARLAELEENAVREQRRLVTVLFSDLVDFTRMTGQMDPEDARELMDAYFGLWRGCIERRLGVVEKYIGDAVMAVFGLSKAHEDDPERAILAAQEMVQELQALNSLTPGTNLKMRVGIHTGPVVTGTLGGQFVAVGETVNLASRLQSAAPDNGILISHDTYSHVRGLFDVKPLAPLTLKGIRDPVQAYLVLRAKPRAFRMGRRGVEGVETRMIGRQGELQRLQEAFFSLVEDRRCQVVTLVGEAGLGKSRLLYEFDNWVELRQEVAYYFKGRAYPALQNTPYAVLRSLFSGRFQITDSDPPAEVRQKLETGFAAALGEGPQTRQQALDAGRLLGFELDEGDSGSDAGGLRERALSAMGSYFRALAAQNPVVVLLEDLHWADSSSLDLLNLLEASFAESPVLVIGAARPALYERRPHWGEGLLFHTRLELQPLSLRESRLLVEEILQKVAEPEQQPVKDLVVDAAEGNPFFIEEMIRMMIDDGVIRTGERRWRVEVSRLNTIRTPPTLTGVLQARFDSLEPEARACLQRGAVIGRIFWDQAVDALASADPGRVEPPKRAAEILPGLRAREMVFQREKSTFDETVEYLFKHALLRDVTYNSLLKRHRRNYHLQAARWLEQMTERTHRQDEFSMLIAEHYEQGGEASRAAQWYLRAGRRAGRQYAGVEAARAFSQALQLLSPDDLPGRFDVLLERERVADLIGAREQQLADLQALAGLAARLEDPERQTTVALRQAEYAFNMGDYPAAMDYARQAGELAGRTGNAHADAESALMQSAVYLRSGNFEQASQLAGHALQVAQEHGWTAVEARTLRAMGLSAYYAGNPGQARTFFAEALQRYIELGDRQGESMAINNLGGASFNLGEYAAAQEYYTRSLLLSREIGDRLGEGRASNNLGIVSVAMGQYARAEAYYLDGLRICREIGHRSFEVSSLDNLGNLALYRYQFSRAQDYHSRSLQTAREIGDRMVERFAIVNSGHGRLLVGDYEGAYAFFQESLALNIGFNDPQGKAHSLFNLCTYFLELGDIEEAARHGQLSLELTRENELPSEEAWSLHALGFVYLAQGLLEQAADVFGQALRIRKELGEPRETVESQAALALAYLRQDKLQPAQELVEQTLTYIEAQGVEGFDQPARIFLTCFLVLQRLGDPRAGDVLQRGVQLIQDAAAQIEDPSQRRSYLQAVPHNRELLQAWEAAGRRDTERKENAEG